MWEEVGRKERELIEEIKQELHRAGATESQLESGMLKGISLKRKVDHIIRQMDELRLSAALLLGLAAALNEAREALGSE